MFYRFARGVCALLVRILFRVRLEGKENIPRGKGYILAANHRTNFDPLFVVTGVHQQIRFMAKAELFRKKGFRWLFNALGAFPVERGKGDSGAIEWAGELLRNGDVLGMFPEGTRSPDGKLLRAKSGAAMIAMQTGADVLPCAICFGEKLSFRTPVIIRFGKIIENSAFGFTPNANSPHEIKNASRSIMDAIGGLLEGYL